MADRGTWDKRYYLKNKEVILEKGRAQYMQNRDEILKKRKAKRTAECPMCHFTFCNNPYLKVHMATRHKLNDDEIADLLSPKDTV